MEKPTYYLWNIWWRSNDYLKDIFTGHRLKWFIQRRRRGFDDRDLWSLDRTIAQYVYPRIKAFNKFSKVSIDPCFFADPEKINHDDTDWVVAKKNQTDAYDKIEEAFFYIVNNDEDLETDFTSDDDENSDPSDLFNKLPEKYLDNYKWKLYKTQIERRTKVIEEGLELFAKHFRTLWN